MAWGSVSWAFKNLVASSKLQQMVDNIDAVKYYPVYHYVGEIDTVSFLTFNSVLEIPIYVPASHKTFRAKLQMKKFDAVGSVTGHLRLSIGTATSADTTTTSDSYEDKTIDIDTSGLSEGWYDFKVEMYVQGGDGSSDKVYMRKLSVLGWPET